MNARFFAFDELHLLGVNATHPLTCLVKRSALSRLLAGMRLPRPSEKAMMMVVRYIRWRRVVSSRGRYSAGSRAARTSP
jgi:hypothetical protein